jgi:heat shock protein HslJ
VVRIVSVRLAATIVTFSLAVVGCAGDPVGSGASTSSQPTGPVATASGADVLASAGLEVGTSWVLTSLVVDDEEVALVDGSPITLERTEQGIDGSAGCNRYGADGQQLGGGDGRLFPPVYVTEMACLDDAVMQVESTYLQALAEVDGAAGEDGALVLSSDRSTLRFEPAG